MVETLRKCFSLNFLTKSGFGEIGLSDEFFGRSKVFFFFSSERQFALRLAFACGFGSFAFSSVERWPRR